MDYRLTDVVADPPGQEAFHTEALIRLPQGFLCYKPPADAPPVVPPPGSANGHITFGSFNNLSKMNSAVIAAWAEILTRLPGAHLILKNKSLRDEPTCARYIEFFAERGVAPERVKLVGWLPASTDHLALYSQIDIALDTFPYNGTTTTCEALWMGVPVIALAGNRHAGLVGASLLTQIGLSDLLAQAPGDYVNLAVQLAGNPDKLAALRASLRERMTNSPLCDARTFVRHIEEAYREMWRRWCQG
jgi:predicted O-linked N-acetylglucosamine transferase (SPINDLY family)